MNDNDGEHEHKRRRTGDSSELDASWGGVNLAIRGSIVVLAVISIAGSGAMLWYLGQVTLHFDDRLSANDTHMHRQDDTMLGLSKQMAEIRSAAMTVHQALTDEVIRNRLYLREIQRVCMMTESQLSRLQQNLSPTMRELLMRGESPLETMEQNKR